MADLFEREMLSDWDSDTTLFSTPTSSLSHRLLTSLFQVLHHYHRNPLDREVQTFSLTHSTFQVAVQVYTMLQLLSLLVLVQADRTQWEQTHWVLQTAAYVRLDSLAVEFEQGFPFFVFTASLIASANVALGYMLLCVYFNRTAGTSLAKKWFQLCLLYLRGIGLVPTICSLLTLSKYSAAYHSTAPEYLSPAVSSLNYHVPGVTLSLFALAGCWFLPISIFLLYDYAQVLTKSTPFTRAHSRIEIFLYFCIFFMVSILVFSESEW